MALSVLLAAALAGSIYAYDVRRIAPASNLVMPTDVIPVAQFYVLLSAKALRSAFKKNILNAVRKRGSQFTGKLAGSADDVEYLIDIIISGQKFTVVVDTES